MNSFRIEITQCFGCGQCLDQCPYDAIQVQAEGSGYGESYINQDKCQQCCACLKIDCPAEGFRRIEQ